MARRWLKIGGGIAAGVTTILALFVLLVSNFGFEITDLTGNFTCEGTYENPCISRFTVRNPTLYDVDIYSKDQTKLIFAPEIDDYALFVPDGRCTATGKCACDMKNGDRMGFEDWRCVDFTNKTKPRTDKVYNFRFKRYSTTEFLLAGIKKESIQTVKWTFGVHDGELDPIWYGASESSKKEDKCSPEFTSSTEVGCGQAIIYSGIRFANDQGVKIEDAPSLKTCQFCDEIKLEIQADKKYPVTVLDYNYTSITLDVKADSTQLNKDIPLKVHTKGNSSDVKYESTARLSSISAKQNKIIPFGFDKKVKWGHNSTTIEVSVEAGDGSVSFSDSDWDTAHDATVGETVDTTNEFTVAAREIDGQNVKVIARGYMPFNTSPIPDNVIIASANYSGYVRIHNNENNDGNDFIVLVDNTQNSPTSLIAADYNESGLTNDPIELSERVDLGDLAAATPFNMSLNSVGLTRIDKTGTSFFAMRMGDDVLDNVPADNLDNSLQIRGSHGGTGGFANFLVITYLTYSVNITDPNSTDATSTSSGENITVTYDFQKDLVNQTSNVETQNITIGGEQCTLLQNEQCDGTPTACSVVDNEDHCTFTGCDWTAAGAQHVFTEPFNNQNNWTDPTNDWALNVQCNNLIGNGLTASMDASVAAGSPLELISGLTDLSGASSANLTFNYGEVGDIESNDCLRYSLFDGSQWSDNITVFCNDLSGSAIEFSLDLNSTYWISNFRFMFIGFGFAQFGEDLCVDDFNVTSVGAESCGGAPNACITYEVPDTCTNSTGCTFENVTEESFTTGIGWQVNCTVGGGCAGSSNDLFLSANFTTDDVLRNDTVTGAISCGVVYSLNIEEPTKTAVLVIDRNAFIGINFTFNKDVINLTENVTVHTVAFNGTPGVIATKDMCEGIPLTCTVYEDSSSCNVVSGCEWIEDNPPYLPIRSGADSTTTTSQEVFNFALAMTNASYAILATSNHTSQIKTVETGRMSSTQFNVSTFTTAGAFTYLAIAEGEYNLSGNDIKCGFFDGVGSVSHAVSFSTDYIDTGYSSVCSTIDASAADCAIRTDTKTTSGYSVDFFDAGDGTEVTDSAYFCAFTQGNYEVNNTLFRVGNFTMGATETQIDMIGTNFTDTDYVVMASQNSYLSGSTERCTCDLELIGPGYFNASCIGMDGSTVCNGERFDYVAMEITNANLSIQCVGTPNACSVYSDSSSCSVVNGCAWNETPQLSNLNGLFSINVTTPNIGVGLYDLSVNASLLLDGVNISRNDTSVESVLINFTPPTVTPNSPEDGASFLRNKNNITLNTTITHDANESMDIFMYAIEISNVDDIFSSLLIKRIDAFTDTELIYNLTVLPVKNTSSDLDLLMHFDNLSSRGESEELIYDWANGDNNGAMIGAIYNRSGVFGYSLQTDGSNYANTSYAPTFTQGDAFTISFWFRTEGTIGGLSDMFSSIQDNSSINIRFEHTACPDGSVAFAVQDSDSESSENICTDDAYDDSEWHQVIATYGLEVEDVKMKLYIDGDLKKEQFIGESADGIKNFSNTPFFIGAANGEGTPVLHFPGQIDELAVWNRKLRDAEILDLHRIQKGNYFWGVNATDPTDSTYSQRNFSIASDILTELTINAVDDESTYLLGTRNITLNYSLIAEDTQTVRIFTSNTSGVFGENSLNYKKEGVVNDTTATHEFNTLPFQPTYNTVLLYHLDEETGETDTIVKDFSTNDNEGTFNKATFQATTDYFADNASTLAWYTAIIGYAARYRSEDNLSYLMWQGFEDSPFIQTYNHSSSNWSNQVQVGINTLPTADDHGSPSFIFDNESYLHVFYGSHGIQGGEGQRYTRSDNPNDITSWTDRSDNLPSVTNGPRSPTGSAYPHPYYFDGKFLLFYRAGSTANDWFYIISIDNGLTWSDPIKILDTTIGTWIWYTSSYQGEEDILHFVSTVAFDTPNGRNRKHAYYWYMNVTEEKFYLVNDTEFSIPLVKDTLTAQVSDFGTENFPQMAFNDSNDVVLSSVRATYNDTQDPKILRGSTYLVTHNYNGSDWNHFNHTNIDYEWLKAPTMVMNENNKLSVYAVNGKDYNSYDSLDYGETLTFNTTLFEDAFTIKTSWGDGRIIVGKPIADSMAHSIVLLHYRSGAYQDQRFDDPYDSSMYLHGDNGFITNIFDFVGETLGGYTDGKMGFSADVLNEVINIDAGNDASLDFDNTKDYTWMAWVYPTDAGTLLSKYTASTGYKFSLNSDLQIELSNGSTNFLNSTVNLTSGEWSHVALTYSNEEMSIYINGSLDSTATNTFASDTSSNLFVGESAASFSGRIDDVVVLNTTLSASEINDTFRLKEGNYSWKIEATDEVVTTEVTTTEERILFIVSLIITDSCSCPSPLTNWELDLEDFCIISINCDIAEFNISFINTGNFTCDANMSFRQITAFPANQRFWSTPSCHINQSVII